MAMATGLAPGLACRPRPFHVACRAAVCQRSYHHRASLRRGRSGLLSAPSSGVLSAQAPPALSDVSALSGSPAAPFSSSASLRKAAPFPDFNSPAPFATPPEKVAVIGGGLTGLTTAFYLSKFLPPTSKITIYESSDRLGGWIDSEPGDVTSDLYNAASDKNGFIPGDVGISKDGKVLFEGGARMVVPHKTLRYDDLILLELVDLLDLDGELRVSSEKLDRYIYYPDHLVKMSPPQLSLESIIEFVLRYLKEPIFDGTLSYRWTEAPRPRLEMSEIFTNIVEYANRNLTAPDESVGDYVAKMFCGDRRPVDNMMSAVMHGIYGGDVNKLSVASTPFKSKWMVDTAKAVRKDLPKCYASVRKSGPHSPESARFVDMLKKLNKTLVENDGWDVLYDCDRFLTTDLLEWSRRRAGDRNTVNRFMEMGSLSVDWSLMGFAGGFGTLTGRLAEYLRGLPNVEIVLNRQVTRIRKAKSSSAAAGNRVVEKVDVVTHGAASAKPAYKAFDKVICTLSGKALYSMTDGALPSIKDEHAVTMQVVTLYYKEPRLTSTYHGFGYLIPQTVPFEENPECALGVMFDTDREMAMRPANLRSGADREGDSSTDTGATRSAEADADKAGTKLTVMMGGHYWDSFGEHMFPTPDEAVEMAQNVVRRHLRNVFPQDVRPVATRAKLCRECIPQHYVGHVERMGKLDVELEAAFGKLVAVAGGNYTATGPGVLPSLRAAREIAMYVSGHGSRALHNDPDELEAKLRFVGDRGLSRFSNPRLDRVWFMNKKDFPLRSRN